MRKNYSVQGHASTHDDKFRICLSRTNLRGCLIFKAIQSQLHLIG